MSARRRILDALAPVVDAPELPDTGGEWTRYAEPAAQFAEVLELVGGRCVAAPASAPLADAIDALPEVAASRRLYSAVPGFASRGIESKAPPEALAAIDTTLAAGRLGVAESGAVWVDGASVGRRAALFLCEHLVLVLRRDQIVDTLHDAYARLPFGEAGFGLFVSGPSKTADIEQALVFGAHGPRSATVLLIGS